MTGASASRAATRGSHCILRHPDGRSTVVPLHSGEPLGPGLLIKIARDIELSRSDVIRLLTE
ncbi:MAG: addiction module toxin, HicA family [Chloroflexota bacterium]|nr:MAG: addiction module toxin, HicA family [Chloroflexota bacterium]